MAYLYLMKDQPARVRSVAPAHAAYWRSVAVPGYQGGPFSDRSGGLITFEIDSWRDAEHLVRGDPFVLHDDAKFFALARAWVQEQKNTQQTRASFIAFVNRNTGRDFTKLINSWLDAKSTW